MKTKSSWMKAMIISCIALMSVQAAVAADCPPPDNGSLLGAAQTDLGALSSALKEHPYLSGVLASGAALTGVGYALRKMGFSGTACDITNRALSMPEGQSKAFYRNAKFASNLESGAVKANEARLKAINKKISNLPPNEQAQVIDLAAWAPSDVSPVEALEMAANLSRDARDILASNGAEEEGWKAFIAATKNGEDAQAVSKEIEHIGFVCRNP